MEWWTLEAEGDEAAAESACRRHKFGGDHGGGFCGWGFGLLLREKGCEQRRSTFFDGQTKLNWKHTLNHEEYRTRPEQNEQIISKLR